ncbi:MAG: serine protease [Celeribacter sp.]|jgi:peptidoglycan hydrolase-like protein with peptidoglycan-binding domain
MTALTNANRLPAALRVLMISLSLLLPLAGGMARAQEAVWLQIEAHPTLAEAEQRARAYAGAFPNVNGFRMASGWYALALGPYSAAGAAAELRNLRAGLLIPSDSYVSDGSRYREPFWPAGSQGLGARPAPPVTVQSLDEDTTPDASTETDAPTEAEQAEATPEIIEETPQQARAAERDLSRQDRMALQEALQWEGFYASAIDGAFGAGTRNAMGAYQAAMGYTPTGVLTTAQRQEILENYRAVFADLDLASVMDEAAQIEMIMPTGKVAFADVTAPFVHYDSRDDSGIRVILISQSGGRSALAGLYNVMQTLEIVPPEGERSRNGDSFTLTGQGDDLESYTWARTEGGTIKGFTVVWKPEDRRVMQRVIETMQQSFRSTGPGALADAAGDAAEQRIDLLAGLEVRRPDMSRSGVYLDRSGAVLTVTELLDSCERLTIAGDYDAEVVARDNALGLAVLKPTQRMSPVGYARFATTTPRLQSELAVSGFSYEDVLDLPVMTYGTMAAARGLDGDDTRTRLEIETLPGDAGGPVLDSDGAVTGVLLARGDGDRQLPENVMFAARPDAISALLAEAGISASTAEAGATLTPTALSRHAADMTVLVSCW